MAGREAGAKDDARAREPTPIEPRRASVATFTTIPSGAARTVRQSELSRRVRHQPVSKSLRWLKAYWVTFRVILSYLSVKLQARVRSPAGFLFSLIGPGTGA